MTNYAISWQHDIPHVDKRKVGFKKQHFKHILKQPTAIITYCILRLQYYICRSKHMSSLLLQCSIWEFSWNQRRRCSPSEKDPRKTEILQDYAGEFTKAEQVWWDFIELGLSANITINSCCENLYSEFCHQANVLKLQYVLLL